MPARSLRSSVLKWPDARDVRQAAKRWASALLETDPRVLRVGYFGSYARGDAGFGSDLDLAVVLKESDLPFERRGILFDTSSLPVPCDLLVYTEDEFRRILERGGRFAHMLEEEAVWFSR